MYCRNCGAELSEGAKFCSRCGTKVQQPSGGKGPRTERKIHKKFNFYPPLLDRVIVCRYNRPGKPTGPEAEPPTRDTIN